jgi:hypothetical protein
MDWERIGEASKKMELLLDIGNDLLLHVDAPKLTLSDKKQLVVINTRFRDNYDAYLWAGFSPHATDIMKAHDATQESVLDKCKERMARTYFGLSCTTKKKLDDRKKLFSAPRTFFGVTALVRASGTPHFTVPGNCACLGANPDEFERDRDLTPHNIDTSLQQTAMLAGVVEFWNSYLRAFEK